MSLLLGFIAATFLSTLAQAKEKPFTSAENNFVRALAEEAITKAINANPPDQQCSLPIVETRDFKTLSKKRPEKTVLDRDGQKQSLSVLSVEEARQIQAYISGQDRLAFGFTESGCVQRAAEIHRILTTQGISSGIIQAFDDSFGGDEGIRVESPPAPAGTVWKFHTAATIAVAEKGKTVVKVLDPGLSPRLLTQSEWLSELQKRSTNETRLQFDFVPLADEVSPMKLERANLTLKIFAEAQKKRAEFLKNRNQK